jgi:nitroreductase
MHELFKKRRSIREFTAQDVNDEIVRHILCAAMVAPSGHNVRPWEFIVIRDKATMQKLTQTHQYAAFAADAPVLIAVLADESKSRYWLQDGTLAAGHIYLEATNQGVGTCWINVYNMQTKDDQDSEEYVRTILNIPDAIRVLCLMPVGYSDKVRKQYEERFDETIVHDEKYGTTLK